MIPYMQAFQMGQQTELLVSQGNLSREHQVRQAAALQAEAMREQMMAIANAQNQHQQSVAPHHAGAGGRCNGLDLATGPNINQQADASTTELASDSTEETENRIKIFQLKIEQFAIGLNEGKFNKSVTDLWRRWKDPVAGLPLSLEAMERRYSQLPSPRQTTKRATALKFTPEDEDDTVCWKVYATGWRTERKGVSYMGKRNRFFQHVQQVIDDQHGGDEGKGLEQVQEEIHRDHGGSISKFIDGLTGAAPKRKRAEPVAAEQEHQAGH